MVNLRNRFAEKKNEGLSTLVPYVTSGFPSAEASVDVLHTLENSGGDVLSDVIDSDYRNLNLTVTISSNSTNEEGEKPIQYDDVNI